MNVEEIERPEKVEKDTGPSLRDELSKAFDVSESEAPAETATPATTEEKTPDAKADDDAAAVSAANLDNAEAGDSGNDDAETPSASLDDQAPVKWTKAEKEKWEALKRVAGDDPETIELVQGVMGILGSRNKSMEAGLTKRFQELATQQKQYEAANERYSRLDSIMEPRREQWAQAGTDEIAVISELMRLNDHAVSNPKDFAKWFIQGRGLSAEDLGFTQAPQKIAVVIDENGNELGSWPIEENGPVGNTPPPQQQAPHQQTPSYQLPPEVQQRIDRLEAAERQRVAEQTNMTNSAAVSMVQEFAQSTDENGNLLYPLFEDVRGTMSALVQSDPNMSLDAAYHAAIAANPELRQMVADSEAIRIRSEMEKAAKANSESARLAASSLPTGGTPTGVRTPLDNSDQKQPSGNLRDILSAQWDNQLKQGRI